MLYTGWSTKWKLPVFFAEHPGYLKINEFYAYTLGDSGKLN